MFRITSIIDTKMGEDLYPPKFWQWLSMALEDLEKCEADPNIVIDMGEWFYRLDERVCHVCLAGSVLIQRVLKNLNEVPIRTGMVGLPRQFEALDKVRSPRNILVAARKYSGALSYRPFKDATEYKRLENSVDIIKTKWCKENYSYVTIGTEPSKFKEYIRDVIKLLKEFEI